MKFGLLLFELELHFLNIVLHALHFELVALQLRLNLALCTSLFFELFCELDKRLILFELDGITLSAQLSRLRLQLLFLALVSVKITPQLPNQFTVLLIIGFCLQSLVFNEKLAAFLASFVLRFCQFLLKLMALSVKLHLEDIKLALCLIILLAKAVHLLLLRVELDAVPALNVLLDLHAHVVSVDWKGHLVRHRVYLALFLLNSPAHIIEALLDCQLKLFFGLNLLGKTFLKLIRLRAHLLIVAFEVVVECIDLLLLRGGCKQMSLHCGQSSLQIIILLSELLENSSLHSIGEWTLRHRR